MKTCPHKYTFCDCPEPLGWRILEWLMAHTVSWLFIALAFVAAACVAVAVWRAL